MPIAKVLETVYMEPVYNKALTAGLNIDLFQDNWRQGKQAAYFRGGMIQIFFRTINGLERRTSWNFKRIVNRKMIKSFLQLFYSKGVSATSLFVTQSEIRKKSFKSFNT